MDTCGRIAQHSLLKLYLYRSYLERYLSILLNTTFYKKIIVHDVFAGLGISNDGNEGSALQGAKTIESANKEGKNRLKKPIELRLNEQNKDNYNSLKKTLSPYNAFTKLSALSADDYIRNWIPEPESHNFFFIDPFGYSQVNEENFTKLFSQLQSTDLLIFIPTYSVYRFLRKEECSEQDKPIAEFLNRFGIDENSVKSVTNHDDFLDLILQAFRKRAGSDYVYKQKIENEACNSAYCLFFVSHHPKGAEMFLSAREKMREFKTSQEAQMVLNFPDDRDTPQILTHLEKDRAYSNYDLYDLGIKIGLLPKEVRAQLELVEQRFPSSILISTLSAKKRKKNAFYIDYKYKNDLRITVSLK